MFLTIQTAPPAGTPLVDGAASFIDAVAPTLNAAGVPESWQLVVSVVLGAALIGVFAFLVDLVARRIVIRLVTGLVERTSTAWDDIFSERRVFVRLARIAPAVVIYLAAPPVFGESGPLTGFVQQAALAYMLIIAILVVDSILNASLAVYQTTELSQRLPMRWLVQVFKIFLYVFGAILLLSVLLDRNPGFFLGGIGAMTAVLMLIFKDSILGFVAGIQLSANQMVRVGDWIEMPQFGADGDVLDVALTTVKVQNWDKTITTIPTYALISSSFKNWRGMSESGGRRIKRALNIDMTSVRFLTDETIDRLAKVELIQGHLAEKQDELREFNEAARVDAASPANGRRLTNLGTFRAYVIEYLRNHPKLRQDMTLLVRQLAPSENGLPLEVYVFTADTEWGNYEGIQADIFDHLLAVLPEFDLRVFQTPTGSDMRLGLGSSGGR